MSCLANKRHNNGGARRTTPLSPTRGREAMEEASARVLKRAIKRLAEPQMCFTRTSSPGVHNNKKLKKCFMHSEGEHTEARNTHTHTHARADTKGCEGPRDTLSHSLSEVSHTGESGRMAGRGELSSRRKICPSRYCLSDLPGRERAHAHTQRKVIDPVTQ